MRLCVVTETYPSTTQTFVYEPVEWLRQGGDEVTVVAEQRGDPPGADAARFPALLVPSWLNRSSKIATFFRSPLATATALLSAQSWTTGKGWGVWEIAARAMLQPVRRAEYLIAHFGPLGARWLPVAGITSRRFAVWFHGYDATSEIRKRPSAYDGLIRSGAAAITNSEYLRGCLVSAGFAPQRIGIVPYAVPHELADADPPPLTSHRILSIARLVPKKGLADSLRAFAGAREALGADWRYQIVGDGPLLAELEALADGLGIRTAVDFSGYLSRAETLRALREASIFILASRTAPSGNTEGTPVSILEAASLGLPVVSTLHAGIPETLPSEGPAEGWVVGEEDVSALTAALVRLSGLDARRRWGDRCRDWVRVRHSPQVHIERTRAVLEQLATVPHPPALRQR